MPYAYVCDCVKILRKTPQSFVMASSNTEMCSDLVDCPLQLTSLPTYSPHIPRDTMPCAITWSHCLHVIQRLELLEVSLRGRENFAETTPEFESSASPVAWHVCSWCSILQLTWCPDCNKYYTKFYCTNYYTKMCLHMNTQLSEVTDILKVNRVLEHQCNV